MREGCYSAYSSLADDPEGSGVAFALVILIQDAPENRIRTRHKLEERHGRLQFPVVGVAEDIRSQSPLNGQHGFRAFPEPPPEDRVGKVLPRFLQALDGIQPRRGTEGTKGTLLLTLRREIRAIVMRPAQYSQVPW